MSNLPPNRHPFEVEAFVLKHYDYSEHDRIVVLYSREYGLLRSIAKGIRRPRSRLAGRLDLLRCNHVILERGHNLHKITQCDVLRSFAGLNRDYHALTHALAMGELVASFSQEEDPNETLFVLFLCALEALAAGVEALPLLIWFELHYLEQLGYEQDWEFCGLCEIDFRPRDYHFFDTAHGGLRCEDCKRKETSRFLTFEQVNVLRQLQAAEEPPVEILELKPLALRQLQNGLQAYFEQLAEKPLKALSYLQEDNLGWALQNETRIP
jgi:DNA repair protein RecO (recombination protein O)